MSKKKPSPDSCDEVQFWKVMKGGDARELQSILFESQPMDEDSQPLPVKRTVNAVKFANSKNPKQLTPLCYAVDNGMEDVIPVLVKAGAKINDHDGTKEKRTPMHAAVAAEEDIIVQSLLRCGADLSVVDGEGRTPLHIAARMSARHVFCFFLELEEVPIVEPPLVDGVRICPVDTLKLLAIQDRVGATALHYALGEVAGGEPALQLADALVRCLTHMASINEEKKKRVSEIASSVTSSGCSALHLLAASGVSSAKTEALARAVVGMGCDPAIREEEGLNALHYAAATHTDGAHTFAAIADALGDDARVALRVDETAASQTPLELAVEEGNKSVLEWVLQHDPQTFVKGTRQTELAALVAKAAKPIQSLMCPSLVTRDALEAATQLMDAQGEVDGSDSGEDEPAGDYTGHGSTTFAGSRVAAARKASSKRKKDDQKTERESIQKVKQNIAAAVEKRDEETAQAKQGGMGLGAKVLVAVLFLSMLLPILDYLLGAPPKRR